MEFETEAGGLMFDKLPAVAEAGILGGGILSDAGIAFLSAESFGPTLPVLELLRFHDRLSFLRSETFADGLRGSCVSDSGSGCGMGIGELTADLTLLMSRGPDGLVFVFSVKKLLPVKVA